MFENKMKHLFYFGVYALPRISNISHYNIRSQILNIIMNIKKCIINLK